MIAVQRKAGSEMALPFYYALLVITVVNLFLGELSAEVKKTRRSEIASPSKELLLAADRQSD